MRRTGGTGSKAASDVHSPVNLCCALLGLQDPGLSQREKLNVNKLVDFLDAIFFGNLHVKREW